MSSSVEKIILTALVILFGLSLSSTNRVSHKGYLNLGINNFTRTSFAQNLDREGDLTNPNKLKNEYDSLLNQIKEKRKEFNKKYESSADERVRKKIIEASEQYVFDMLTDKIFPLWYGTPWAFNGLTQVPRHEEGIACGYFVTTTLRDVGFNLERKQLGDQPAEYIIKNLTGESNIYRFRNKSLRKLLDKVQELGKGLYIVGLDLHVGFLINKQSSDDRSNTVYFVHSLYYEPACVVSEEAGKSFLLINSEYRVIGKILDTSLMRKWISGEKIPTRYDYFRR